MVDTEGLEFQIWLHNGIQRGWVSMPYCGFHDDTPTTKAEEIDLEKYGEACMRTVRVWM
jgi:hypothetical protein